MFSRLSDGMAGQEVATWEEKSLQEKLDSGLVHKRTRLQNHESHFVFVKAKIGEQSSIEKGFYRVKNRSANVQHSNRARWIHCRQVFSADS